QPVELPVAPAPEQPVDPTALWDIDLPTTPDGPQEDTTSQPTGPDEAPSTGPQAPPTAQTPVVGPGAVPAGQPGQPDTAVVGPGRTGVHAEDSGAQQDLPAPTDYDRGDDDGPRRSGRETEAAAVAAAEESDSP